MPKLIRLYIVNVLIGFAISAAFLGVVLMLDVAGLRHLVLDTPSGWIAGLLFFLSNGLVFAGVQFAIAVMNLAEDDPSPPPGPRRPILHPATSPVRPPPRKNR